MKSLLNLVKSKSDPRLYLFTKLANQINCLMIQDVKADKSAAALNVNVGSLKDPNEIPGIAHFLEHMLFMGTRKYPSENDFSEFLNQNSGYSNAYTDLDCTNYFFEVGNSAFTPAVDRFAQFFHKPLFSKSAVEREMKAVDSENKKNLQSDSWRFMQLFRSEGHPSSLFAKFATGNYDTLNKSDIRERLMDYHRKYYSSNLMSLVLLSPKPVEEMKEMASSLFSGVKLNRGISGEKLINEYSSVYPYHQSYDNLGYFYRVIPIKNKDQLTFYWIFNENLNPAYNEKPLYYLSSLLGHEGPNSLSSSLKKDDLITNLSCGHYTIANTYSPLYLQIDLTQKGMKNIHQVTGRVLYFINLLKSKDINERFFQELMQIAQMKFDYKNKEEPINYCSDLAHWFGLFPPQDILTGAYIIKNFDKSLIKRYLHGLNLDNLNIYLSSKALNKNDCPFSEKWYGTQFGKEKMKHGDPILSMKETASHHHLSYPPENKFIPKSFELLPKKNNMNKFPQKISDTNNSSVFYKQDDTFHLPKAYIFLQIYLNYQKQSLSYQDYQVMSSIWNSILENELKEKLHMASEANVNFQLSFNNDGLKIQVTGFNSSMSFTLLDILKDFQEIISGKRKIEDFELKIQTQIADLKKNLSNFYFNPPYSQVMANAALFCREPSSTPKQQLIILERLSKNLTRFKSFISECLKESRCEWLFQGNISKEECIEISKKCKELLISSELPLEETNTYRITNIPIKTNYYYIIPSEDTNNKNSSIVSLYQAGNLSEKEKCTLYLIESILREKFFDELRTKQTLGYVVKLTHFEMRKIHNIACLVQSSEKSPEYCQTRITNFFKEFNISGISDEIFEMHRNSVIVELMQKDLTLMEESSRNFNEIICKDYNFDRKNQQIQLLQTITRKEVEKMFKDMFISSQRRLDIEVLARNHTEENEMIENETRKTESLDLIKRVKINSLEHFKKIVPLFPDYYSGCLNKKI